ncbi:MAG TPA: hypothetical protein VNO86_03435 [Candidatus Binatia bacterium]|nr:hypothetical protein [Candidatus Binatia bacterium]
MSARPPEPQRPARRPVEYKGAPLDPERGPGLGCFWIQVVLLVVFIVATPLSVGRVPDVVTAALLFVVIGLLFFVGQTAIFLLRLVAAERREARRRPLASASKTVGELEAEAAEAAGQLAEAAKGAVETAKGAADEAGWVAEEAGVDEAGQGGASGAGPSVRE